MPKVEIRPFADVQREYDASLNNYKVKAMMLHEAVTTMLALDVIPRSVADTLRQRCAEFEKAQIG